jgi:type I restriction enzyme, S subunit
LKTNVIESSWLHRDGIRLGSQYHCDNAQKALRNLAKSGIAMQRLQDRCQEIFIPGIFKRPYVEDPNYGLPYITGSTMILTQPKKDCKYLSQTRLPNKAELELHKGMILVTCSGTIGRAIIVTNELHECVGSQDILRIVPDEQKTKLGFLYAYLSTSIGRSLMTRQTYGSVVDHINASHVYDLPVPVLGEEKEDDIHQKIMNAWKNREQANQLLEESQQQLLDVLHLPPLANDEPEPQNPLFTFNIQSDQLDFRLDASHYNPPGRKALHILEDHSDCRILGDVTERIFHPFRMNMVLVEKGYGVTFLGGGDIIQLRYYGDKYISSVTESYEDYLLQRGWTLMTIGGTIGRIAYVGDYLNGSAASQHVTRIVPEPNYLLPGYLYAFMESKYAQEQVKSLIYGSVVDTVRESQLRELRILVPDREQQQPIHDNVEEAYRLRYEANCLEDEAQSLLMQTLGLESQ